MISIEHTHAEGTLVHGTERGDGSRDALRKHRLRWSRNLGCWFVPQSRDRNARNLEGLAEDLRAAGFDVEVSVDNERRAVADVQSDRLHRSAARADGLAAKAARLDGEASAGAARTRELMDVIPFGQPILVGHHSERRHRAHIGRIESSVQKTAEAFREAEGARYGARAAAANVARADSPSYIGNRIEEAERDLRAAQRGHRRLDGSSTGPLVERVAEAEERLGYWRGELVRVQEQLGVRVFAKADIEKGGAVKHRGRWSKVVRASAKSVSVETGYSWTDRVPYTEIRDYRSPAQLAQAATIEEG